jgi:hypothetical protein
MERYQKCPYCNIVATERKWLKTSHWMKSMSFDQIQQGIENTGGEDSFKEKDCIEFHPCGHTFYESDIKMLDSIYDKIAELQSHISQGNFSNKDMPMILTEVNKMEDRLHSARWRVASKRVFGPVEE